MDGSNQPILSTTSRSRSARQERLPYCGRRPRHGPSREARRRGPRSRALPGARGSRAQSATARRARAPWHRTPASARHSSARVGAQTSLGLDRRPLRPTIEVASCDLKDSASSLVSPNMKSSRKFGKYVRQRHRPVTDQIFTVHVTAAISVAGTLLHHPTACPKSSGGARVAWHPMPA